MAGALSTKRIQVDKATRSMVISVAAAVFVIFFCLLSAHSLSKVLSYQNRVINQQTVARNKLSQDVTASQQLGMSYSEFNNNSGNNLLGQSVNGTGTNQGDNSKLVLDALPSVFDYPAMVVSLQNLFTYPGVTVTGISLTNVSNSSGGVVTATSATGTSAIPVPLSFSVNGSLSNIQGFISHVSKSILPVQFLTVDISGSQGNTINMTITAQVYYQPATQFKIGTETVK